MSEMETVLPLRGNACARSSKRDMATAEPLHHENYELISPGGHRHTKTSYLADVASKRLEYLAFEPASPVAVRATADLVVLRYIARIRLCVGIADEVKFRAWHTDHYERHGNQWQVVWPQATSLSD
jgi:hypothetical protein